MNSRNDARWLLLLVAWLVLSMLACGWGSSSGPGPITPTATPGAAVPLANPTSTATLTPSSAGFEEPTREPSANPCVGQSGEIEVRVLVGPADAVGLEPVAVGSVPYAVTTDQEPFLLQGAGPVSYADALVAEWGTYEVTMDLEITVSGECTAGVDGAVLAVVLEMTGEQMVEVTAEGFHGEYPWAGSHSFDLSLPAEEGATVQGEGYTFVLHPHSP
jgi:hypothetical protein